MAYRIDDPYNSGIGTPDLGLGNIDQANNIELAKTFNTRQGLLDIGAAEKGLVYGHNPTVVGDFIGTAKKLHDAQGMDIGGVKHWMTDDKRQKMYEEYLDESGTKFIPEIQKALEKGLFENKEDFGNQLLYKEAIKNKGDQAFLDLDNIRGVIPGYNPYAGMDEGETALNPAVKKLWDLYKFYNTARKAKKYVPKVKKWVTKKTPTITTAKGPPSITQKKITTGGPTKIKSYDPSIKKTGPTYGPHKKTKYKPPQQTGGGGGVHSGMKTTSSRRHKAPGGSGYGPHKKADGGLINFYKYGGFLG